MKIFLDSVGCRLNHSEIERMALEIRRSGHEVVSSPELGDLVVLNTCAVTAAAAADSRSRARQALRRNPNARIVLTGCWSSLEPEAASAMDGVTSVISNQAKDRLVQDILGGELEFDDHVITPRLPLPGRNRRTRAFIKAQDGCNQRCAFCVTTVVRGPARSRPVPEVVAEVQAAVLGHAKEAVLTGVSLTSYGTDLPGNTDVGTLVRAVLDETGLERLRLSSLEPWGMPEHFFELWRDPRLCRHLHLPLQSGCRRTVRRMRRPSSPAAFETLVREARAAIPGLAISTDIIVGFPGETEDDFAESIAFVERMSFSRMHVFSFSPRPGTRASEMPEQIPPGLTRERSRIMRLSGSRSQLAFQGTFQEQELPVLWESAIPCEGAWQLSGLTSNYLRVSAHSDADLSNTICQTRLTDTSSIPIQGELVGVKAALSQGACSSA